MSMQVGPSSGDEFEANSTINTTPLVDIMLVMLIIFLITIPVVIKTVPLKLPTVNNQATVTKPENVVISINKAGHVFWNDKRVSKYSRLLERVKETARMVPQPEIHIRADLGVNYEFVGRVIVLCQRGGIGKVGFIIEPDLSNRGR